MASRPASKMAGSGFPVVTAFLPEAVSIAATIEPVPGQSPSGIGMVGSTILVYAAMGWMGLMRTSSGH